MDRWRKLRWASLAVAVWLVGCGGSGGTVSGKVLVDGAPAQGQEVTLQGGAKLRTATTGADGSYQLPDVPEGGYLLSVDVASTQERHLQVAVSVKAPLTLPDLTFQGVAALSGTVTDAAGAPVPGAQVQVLGTQVSGSTDATGRFVFSAVPTGTRTVAATAQAGSAQAEVTLARGEAQDVALSLAAAPPATLTGQVGFFAQTDLSIIEISVPAAGVTTHASKDGQYRLSVPPGDWDLYAEAPYYPSQKIGHVSASSGQAIGVPTATLSLYTELPTFGVPEATWLAVDTLQRTPRQVALLELRAPGTPSSYYAFDLETRGLRLICVGNEPALRADGHYAAVPSATGALVMNLVAGTSFFVPTPTSLNIPAFSSDGTRVSFSTEGPAPRTYYSVAVEGGPVYESPTYRDIWMTEGKVLLQNGPSAPYSWYLVASPGITNAFYNVPDVSVGRSQSPLGTQASSAYGVQACATPPCPLYVLAPDATVAIASTWKPAGASIYGEESTGRWLLVRHVNEFAVVDTATGAATVLPAGTNDGSFSPDGTRFVFRTGLDSVVYEHALPLPDPATLTPVITSTAPVQGRWISGNRYAGFDEAPTSGAPYRYTIEGGVLTRDANYEVTSGYTASLYTAWRGTDGVFHLFTADGQVLDAPEGQTDSPALVLSELQLQATENGPAFIPAHRVLVSWGDGKGWVYDGDAPPRAIPLPPISPTQFRFMGNLAFLPAPGDVLELVDVNTGQHLQLQEPGVDELHFDLSPGSETSLIVAGHPSGPSSSTGNPVGGAYAILPSFLIPF